MYAVSECWLSVYPAVHGKVHVWCTRNQVNHQTATSVRDGVICNAIYCGFVANADILLVAKKFIFSLLCKVHILWYYCHVNIGYCCLFWFTEAKRYKKYKVIFRYLLYSIIHAELPNEYMLALRTTALRQADKKSLQRVKNRLKRLKSERLLKAIFFIESAL